MSQANYPSDFRYLREPPFPAMGKDLNQVVNDYGAWLRDARSTIRELQARVGVLEAALGERKMIRRHGPAGGGAAAQDRHTDPDRIHTIGPD